MATRHKRMDAGYKLVELLPENWLTTDGRILHYCAFGCCGSRAEAVGKVQQALDDFLLLCRPRVPALNRWTRVYQPTAWWTLALALLGIIPRCWSHLSQPAPPDLIAAATGDGAGPATEFTYRAQQRVRWNKATAWLVDVRTLPRLLTCTTLMLPALDIMADIFCANKKTYRSSILRIGTHRQLSMLSENMPTCYRTLATRAGCQCASAKLGARRAWPGPSRGQ